MSVRRRLSGWSRRFGSGGFIYRRVAGAMGLPDDAFIKEEYIPTPEEYLEQQERAQAELQHRHTKVPVARLTDPRQLLDVFGAHSSIVDDHYVADDDLELVASCKENFRDWADVVSELPETARLEAAKSLLEEARAIERAGYAVGIGLTDRYGIRSVRMTMNVPVFFPKPGGTRLGTDRSLAIDEVSDVGSIENSQYTLTWHPTEGLSAAPPTGRSSDRLHCLS